MSLEGRGGAPILDDHAHLDPFKGRHVDAVKEFERAGGTHIIVSHMPYGEMPVRTAEDFRKSFDVTVGVVGRVNEATSVKAFATVGPYPAELLGLEKTHGLEKAKEIMVQGMDIAASYVEEGDALAIGEVGRPHFPVSAEAMAASNEIMLHGMRRAKEVGCAIVLHAESATPESMKELAGMARSVGLDTARVVKHYCGPLVLPEENSGLMPSVLASKENIAAALGKGLRFMMETDFMDDPRRPGAVMNITTVPKRTSQLLKDKTIRLDDAYRIHYDNPRETYGPAFV